MPRRRAAFSSVGSSVQPGRRLDESGPSLLLIASDGGSAEFRSRDLLRNFLRDPKALKNRLKLPHPNSLMGIAAVASDFAVKRAGIAVEKRRLLGAPRPHF
jgi:hypothetical protein